MKLKKIEKSKTQIPEWNDNLKEPVEEQVILNWGSFPSAEQIETYKAFKYDDEGNVILSYRSGKLLRDHLDSIENLTDGDGKKIITPADLCNHKDPRFSDLIAEARNYGLKKEEPISEGESEALK